MIMFRWRKDIKRTQLRGRVQCGQAHAGRRTPHASSGFARSITKNAAELSREEEGAPNNSSASMAIL